MSHKPYCRENIARRCSETRRRLAQCLVLRPIGDETGGSKGAGTELGSWFTEGTADHGGYNMYTYVLAIL